MSRNRILMYDMYVHNSTYYGLDKGKGTSGWNTNGTLLSLLSKKQKNTMIHLEKFAPSQWRISPRHGMRLPTVPRDEGGGGGGGAPLLEGLLIVAVMPTCVAILIVRVLYAYRAPMSRRYATR